jgi:hypothetical protein
VVVMTFNVGRRTTFAHTVTIHSNKELWLSFTLPCSWGVITFDCTISCEPPRRKRQRSDSIEHGRHSAAETGAQHMSEVGGPPRGKRRKSGSVGNDCSSAAATGAQEMLSVGGL